MRHQIDPKELDGFESRTVLASSSGNASKGEPGKKLEIVTKLYGYSSTYAGTLITVIEVRVNAIVKITTNSLPEAIKHYNKY